MALTDPLLAATLGRFRIDRLLGEGGMGRVYAGTDMRTEREVAIKVIGEEHARDAELIGRFYAEAHAASRIQHPNIIEVLDLAYLDDGRPAIVMELVAGATLRSFVEAGTLSVEAALDIVVQVLDAIAAAHEVGIVHRDLKPDNIVVDAHGHVKVLDFGIAKLTGTETGGAPRTRTGVMLGTPEYMAPEQITGAPVDARTDIYSAGVVLYEILTGRRPFTADSQFEILRAHIETPPPSPRWQRAELPEVLAQITMQAMAKVPEQRFATAREMAAALIDTRSRLSSFPIDGGPVPSPALPFATPVPAPRRRWWPAIAIAAFVAVGVAAALVVKTRRSPPIAGPTAPVPSPAQRPAPKPVLPPANPDFATYPAPANRGAFDPIAALGDATRIAREMFPDAVPIYGEFLAVRSDGTLDLAAQPGNPRWMFWSPAVGATRPASLAPNLEYRATCVVIVEFDRAFTRAIRGQNICDRKPTLPPRCTLKQVWARGTAKGAKSTYAARIAFGDGVWRFDIDNVPPRDHVSLSFKDDCR